MTLSRRLRPIRSHNIDILHCFNTTRVIVFKRWSGREQVIVFASLNNTPYENGYVISRDLPGIPDGQWKELFNSDAPVYGGRGAGNAGSVVFSHRGSIEAKVPANGFILLLKEL